MKSKDPFIIAIKRSRIQEIEKLLNSGVEINDDAIILAIKRNRIQVIETLLNHGVKINDDAIMLTVKKQGTEILRLFIKEGVDLSKGNYIEEAAKYTNLTLVKILFQGGASIRLGNPLSEVIRRGEGSSNMDILKYLLENGANPSKNIDIILDKNISLKEKKRNLTPYMLAGECGYEDIKKLLLQYNANPIVATTIRRTELLTYYISNKYEFECENCGKLYMIPSGHFWEGKFCPGCGAFWQRQNDRH